MSKPKFMTLKELLKREKEEQRKRNLEEIGIDAIENAVPPSPSPKRSDTSNSMRPLENVRTLSDLKSDADDSEDLTEEEIRRYTRPTVASVIKLIIAISMTMFVVIMYVKFVCVDHCNYRDRPNPLLPLDDPKEDSKSKKTINAVVSVLMIMVPIVVATFVLVLIFYLRCDKLLYVILGLSFGIIFVLIASVIFKEILIKFNIAFDSITGSLLVWNYSVLAMISIFWRAPLFLNQAFLVNMAALVAINIMKTLSEWTTWALLMVLVIWDLIAVLCPFGPLNLLVSYIQKRKNENKDYALPPGLLYSTSGMIWYFVILESVPNNKREENETNDNRQRIRGHEGPRLGLGDFVFYSLLIGKAAIYGDFNLILGCYVAILMGFLLTLVLLVIYEQPLPALPISITLGILIFFISYFCVTPFLNKLNSDLIYF